MLPLLFLAHTAIAVAMVFLRPLGDRERARLVRMGALVGMGVSALLFLVRGNDETWGAAQLEPDSGAIVAAAAFCAWAIVASGAGGSARWDVGALVGAGSTGLALFATSGWIVPAMLFWVVVSVATAVAVPASRRSAGLWLTLVLSDACFVGGWIAVWLDTSSWALPDGVEGWALIPLAAAIVLRTGALAGEGSWELSSGPQAAMLPLVVGSGFALVPAVSRGEEVYLSLGLLVVAAALVGWAVASTRPRLGPLGAWTSAVMLALCVIEPEALGRAGVAALLGTTVIVLWPHTGGRAQAERGLLLSAVPLTVGFGAIVGGAGVSFERATLADSVLSAAPWSAVAALLPVALAGGVTLGAQIARRSEPEHFEPGAVLVTWGIAVVALVLGLAPRADLAFSGGGTATSRAMWLFVVAAIAGVVAARVVGKVPGVKMEPGEPPGPHPARLDGGPARAVALATAAAAVPILGAVAWLTYEGLRNGFL